MSRPVQPPREREALREVGSTEVKPWVARVLVALFLLTGGTVPLLELTGVAGSGGSAPSVDVARRVASALAAGRPLAANRVVLEELERLEASFEEGSLLQQVVVPWAQWAETRLFADGNRQALLGVGDWLFYRPDLEHVTGRPFLDREVMEARATEGASWTMPPNPDPRPAIRALHRQLEERGIALVVMPTPVKPMVEPQRFEATAASSDTPFRNASYERFRTDLEAGGIPIFDPGPLLVDLSPGKTEEEENGYLVHDTHWTPIAMERVAEALAAEIEPRLDSGSSSRNDSLAYRRRPVDVRGTGDIARMLRLPPEAGLFPPQEVTTQMITTPEGGLWRPERGAPVLLLGDSFTNVYSEDGLGWGRSAGLAEQLSYFLGRPVDRIAINAGGAHTTREALARALRSDPRRLDGVELVVYQFAARELSQGDWRTVDIFGERGEGSSDTTPNTGS